MIQEALEFVTGHDEAKVIIITPFLSERNKIMKELHKVAQASFYDSNFIYTRYGLTCKHNMGSFVSIQAIRSEADLDRIMGFQGENILFLVVGAARMSDDVYKAIIDVTSVYESSDLKEVGSI